MKHKSKIKERISQKAAEILLDIGAINFNIKKPFKLTSGKLSPIYCDCRRIISFPDQRMKLINYAVTLLREKSYFNSIDNIAGGETAGIPFAAFISYKLKLPMTYIRKKSKEFGRKEQVEGIVKNKQKVVLVEDLITDGGSKWNFVESLITKKAIVTAVLVIFNYGIFTNKLNYRNKSIDLIYLTNWRSVLEVAMLKNKINEKEIEIIQKFLDDIGVKNIGVKNLKSFQQIL
tara:strand:- start:575 stop:1270 length:696 start_codon:yes stop_codon:yes gene_type:complete